MLMQYSRNAFTVKVPRGNKFSDTLGLRQKEDNPDFYCNENHYSFIVYNNNRIELKYYCSLTIALVVY